jgi:hypothetical protein
LVVVEVEEAVIKKRPEPTVVEVVAADVLE